MNLWFFKINLLISLCLSYTVCYHVYTLPTLRFTEIYVKDIFISLQYMYCKRYFMNMILWFVFLISLLKPYIAYCNEFDDFFSVLYFFWTILISKYYPSKSAKSFYDDIISSKQKRPIILIICQKILIDLNIEPVLIVSAIVYTRKKRKWK